MGLSFKPHCTSPLIHVNLHILSPQNPLKSPTPHKSISLPSEKKFPPSFFFLNQETLCINHGVTFSGGREGPGPRPSIIRHNVHSRISYATNKISIPSSCDTISGHLSQSSYKAPYDLPGELGKSNTLFQDGYDEQLEQSSPLGIKGDHSSPIKHSSDVPYYADGLPRRTAPNGASPHPLLLRCGKDLKIDGDHHNMLDRTAGQGVQLRSNSMGTPVLSGSRTRSSTRTKSPINYKELAYGASGKRNRQHQMATVDQTMQSDNSKVCMGSLQENGRKNVWDKAEDKQRHSLQLDRGEDGGAMSLNTTGNNGRGSEFSPTKPRNVNTTLEC